HRLTLGDLADEHLAGLCERDHRRGGAGALCVGDDGGFATLEYGDDAVRRTEVNADGTSHVWLPPGRPAGLSGRSVCGWAHPRGEDRADKILEPHALKSYTGHNERRTRICSHFD